MTGKTRKGKERICIYINESMLYFPMARPKHRSQQRLIDDYAKDGGAELLPRCITF